MSHTAKKQYLIAILERYQKSSKKYKKAILDEFCAVCGYSRKYAIRLLNNPFETNQLKKQGLRPKYSKETKEHLIALWHAMGRICSKRLVKAMPEWLEYYESSSLTDEMLIQLKQISASTIDRLLKSERTGKGRSTTKPSMYWYKSRIPIQAEDSHIQDPGFVTSDTVAHCGEVISGEYAHSLTVTDLATTWTENRATWRKGGAQVKLAMEDIERNFPFAITGFKSDCGAEFINSELFKYFVQREEPIQFYRSRPYQKNDNCHVEQKNLTHVRRLFGYDRFDNEELVYMMNDIYKNYWNPLQNYFIPTMKLIKKERINGKIKKTFDEPKTPFQRILNSDKLSSEEKEDLIENKKKLNPFQLKMDLEIKLKEFKTKINKLNNLLMAA
ncbi:MAG: hypothetical protein KDD50_14025 [Bdellovibrionales bacterium]|nr:hypothetical protein [Bdellovibrionales bacterium]